jgi:hypothetical protein
MDHHVGASAQDRAQLFASDIPFLFEVRVRNFRVGDGKVKPLHVPARHFLAETLHLQQREFLRLQKRYDCCRSQSRIASRSRAKSRFHAPVIPCGSYFPGQKVTPTRPCPDMPETAAICRGCDTDVLTISTSIDADRLEDCIDGVGIEGGLEFREQLGRHSRDIRRAGHR